TDNFIYAGTVGGRIFVTFTGGGQASGTTNQWLDISGGLNGSPVVKIVADPVRGSHDAYAATTKGVFYNANVTDPATSWVPVTGSRLGAGNPPASLQFLTTLAADWRDKIPNIPVASLTSVGTTATVTTVNPLSQYGIKTGQAIVISGANEPGYDTGPQ